MDRTYQAVLFDWDGVIFGSDGPVHRAVNALLTHHRLPPESYESFRHRPHNHFTRYIEQGISWTEEQCRKFFYEHYDSSRCELIQGAREVLEHLQEEGLPCGIVSAHYEEDLLRLLQQFGIHEHFPQVFGSTRHKKDALQKVCGAFDIPYASALFVGDVLGDVLDDKAAGVTTVLYAPADSPHKGEADHHITHLEQLKGLLNL